MDGISCCYNWLNILPKRISAENKLIFCISNLQTKGKTKPTEPKFFGWRSQPTVLYSLLLEKCPENTRWFYFCSLNFGAVPSKEFNLPPKPKSKKNLFPQVFCMSLPLLFLSLRHSRGEFSIFCGRDAFSAFPIAAAAFSPSADKRLEKSSGKSQWLSTSSEVDQTFPDPPFGGAELGKRTPPR